MSESNMYECEECPLYGELMWNGRCKNPDCTYHWNQKTMMNNRWDKMSLKSNNCNTEQTIYLLIEKGK